MRSIRAFLKYYVSALCLGGRWYKDRVRGTVKRLQIQLEHIGESTAEGKTKMATWIFFFEKL